MLRAGEVVFEGPCTSLRRHKLSVESVGRGTECGVELRGFSEFRPGDALHCIATEMVRPEALTAKDGSQVTPGQARV